MVFVSIKKQRERGEKDNLVKRSGRKKLLTFLPYISSNNVESFGLGCQRTVRALVDFCLIRLLSVRQRESLNVCDQRHGAR